MQEVDLRKLEKLVDRNEANLQALVETLNELPRSIAAGRPMKISRSKVNPDGSLGSPEQVFGTPSQTRYKKEADFTAAAQAYASAAQRGHLLSLHRLAHLSKRGLGVAPQCQTALSGFKAVAERGIWGNNLARAYRSYDSGDKSTALRVFSRMAAMGYEAAQFNTAWLLSGRLRKASEAQHAGVDTNIAASASASRINSPSHSKEEEKGEKRGDKDGGQGTSKDEGEGGEKPISRVFGLLRQGLSMGARGAAMAVGGVLEKASGAYRQPVCPLWSKDDGDDGEVVDGEQGQERSSSTSTGHFNIHRDKQSLTTSYRSRSSNSSPFHTTSKSLSTTKKKGTTKANGGDEEVSRHADCQSRALAMYGLSAGQGNAEAYVRIGDFYYYGLGKLNRDKREAAELYQSAADLHHTHAIFNLGVMHEVGDGVQQDLHLAKRFYDQAVEFNPDAQVCICVDGYEL